MSDAIIQSFITKIWLEETVEEAGRAMWRGHVTHVPSGERRYVKTLGDIERFIALYLEEMGVRLGRLERVRRSIVRFSNKLNNAYAQSGRYLAGQMHSRLTGTRAQESGSLEEKEEEVRPRL